MITKIVITDNENAPLHYLKNHPNFKNGTEYVFKPYVNVIVGPNGSGKSTLINLIRKYMSISDRCCELKLDTYQNLSDISGNFKDGVGIYGDWCRNVFRLQLVDEMRLSDNSLNSFENFALTFDGMNASVGEGTMCAIQSLFDYMYSQKPSLVFPLKDIMRRSKSFDNKYEPYIDYIKKHHVECANQYTVLMDEPDRNLDVFNIDQLIGILSYKKEDTQLIVTIHNPLILYKLADCPDINFVELKPGYVNEVCNKINDIVRK